MKLKMTFLLRATTVSAASALSIASLGAASSVINIETTESTTGGRKTPSAQQVQGAAKASDLVGMIVKNKQDVTLGAVADLAVDVESGRLVTVILTVSDSTGQNKGLTAVPPTVLHHDAAGKVMHLDSTAENFASAPQLTMDKWAEFCSIGHLAAAYKYYGAEKDFNFVDKRKAAEADSKEEKSGVGEQFLIPASRISSLQKVSKLIGTPVTNKRDEELGKVENFIVNISGGRLLAVIVSSGKYLSMADEFSAVPPAAMRFSIGRANLCLDTNKEALTAAPHFQGTEWPDFTEPDYSARMYRAYKLEPYFTTDDTTRADNSARKKREESLTPMDQGNSKADIATTAQIRKEVMALNDLSLTAKNVIIITNEGKVTLRGQVNSAAEKKFICEIAERIAKAEHVDNQLEVKSAAEIK